MNTHERFLTVVRFLAQIYSAGNSTESTKVMQESLQTILHGKVPATRMDWHVLGKDVTRILKVWLAKENDPVAQEVANQIADLLQEFDSDPVTPRPTLTVTEYVHAMPDVIQHVQPSQVVVDDEGVDATESDSQVEYKEVEEEGVDPELEDDMTAKEVEEEGVEPEFDQISMIPHAAEDTRPIVEEEEEEVEEVEEEVVEEVVEEVEEEVMEEEEVEEVEEEVVEEEEEVEEEVEEEEEEEVVEPEEEVEEEEEGDAMEVEQITIRGRQYWLETNTKKIYAVVDGDDVGDEVGEMVANKPRFYAK